MCSEHVALPNREHFLAFPISQLGGLGASCDFVWHMRCEHMTHALWAAAVLQVRDDGGVGRLYLATVGRSSQILDGFWR